ncbi:MAG: hypothetical protein IKN38_04340, partial [Clostridia bacterium]|nr:hypothetical protein [Clostridia bacterium]
YIPEVYAASNETLIYDFLTNTLHFNAAQACGVLANIYEESRFIPTAYGIDVDGLPSYGLCQWHAGRIDSLKDYCASNGLDYTTVNGQMSYLVYELNNSEKYAYTKILGIPNTADGAYDAGYNWSKYFERGVSSLHERRGNLSRGTYWTKYGSSGGEVVYATITEGDYYIRNNSTGKYLTVPSKQQSNGTDLGVASLEANNYFKINVKKQTYGYVLKPKYTTSHVANVYATIVQSGKRVTLYEPTGDASQEWYFDATAEGYIIRCVQAPSCVMDLYTKDSKTLVNVTTYNSASASQVWSLVPTAAPGKATPVVTPGLGGETTSITWNDAANCDGYELTIINKSNNTTVVSTSLSTTEYSVILPAGSYSARVDSINSYLSGINGYTTTGDTVSFTVLSPHVHDFTGAEQIITDATCTAAGSKRVYCKDTSCGEFITVEIPIKAHTYNTVFSRPKVDTDGSIVKICSVCGYSYTELSIPHYNGTGPLICVSDCEIPAGKTFTLPVTLKNFSGGTSAVFYLEYDHSKLALISVSPLGTSFSSFSVSSDKITLSLAGSVPSELTVLCRFTANNTPAGNIPVDVTYNSGDVKRSGQNVYPATDAGTVSIVSQTAFFGDANRDGKVNTKDILLIRKFLSSLVSDSDLDYNRADVDGSDSIDYSDVLYLRRYLTSNIDKLPADN